MEKLYRLLPWLDSVQAVDYLRSLTNTELKERDLIALCDTPHCNAYINCDGIKTSIPGFSEADGHIRLSGLYALSDPGEIKIPSYDGPGDPLLSVSGLQIVNGEACIYDALKDEIRREVGIWVVDVGHPIGGVHILFKPKELEALADKMSDSATKQRPTPVSEKHRRTLLVLIGALCEEAGINISQRGASQRIRVLTEQLGAPVDDETIRKVLADIPDALERRFK